jgi:predicted Zn-dependent peptidase
MRALFQNHPLGMPVVGTRENLLNIQASQLRAQRSAFYTPQSSILVVSSDKYLNHNIAHIERLFNHSWHTSDATELPPNRKRATPFAKGTTVVAENHPESQLDIKLLFPAHGGSSEEVIAQTFFQRVLDDGIASRLPSSIRERAGLAYDVSCDMSIFSDVGTCSIDASISDEGLSPFLDILKGEIDHAVHKKPAPSEMERVRNRYTFSLETLREDTSAHLDYLVWNSFLGSTMTPEQELEIVRGLTPAHIQTAAQKIFGANRKVAALVGPGAKARSAELGQFLNTLPTGIAPS